jgi:hypothetical protein
MYTNKISLLRFLRLSVTCLLFCHGCAATYVWTKPGEDDQQAEQMRAACTLEAEHSYLPGEDSKEARVARIERWVSLCMRASGWRKQEIPWGNSP